jgi:hypothetical protein
MEYLRFIQSADGKWTPAAGTFDGWPKTAQELKCLDPCMGSGHFVVAMFERLVALRLAEESLDEADAVAAVIRDNLFGLEIDPRCTQIAAFNLALAAWRRWATARCRRCTSPAPASRRMPSRPIGWRWLATTTGSSAAWPALHAVQGWPGAGQPHQPPSRQGRFGGGGLHELQPLLEKALAQETKDDTAHEMAVTARGVAKAAEILAGQFTLASSRSSPPTCRILQTRVSSRGVNRLSIGGRVAWSFVFTITSANCGSRIDGIEAAKAGAKRELR